MFKLFMNIIMLFKRKFSKKEKIIVTNINVNKDFNSNNNIYINIFFDD